MIVIKGEIKVIHMNVHVQNQNAKVIDMVVLNNSLQDLLQGNGMPKLWDCRYYNWTRLAISNMESSGMDT